MVVNRRVYTPVEFMYSYPWHKPFSLDRLDRAQAGRSLGHSHIPGGFVAAKRNHHLPDYGWLCIGSTFACSAVNTTGYSSSHRRNYAARWTEFCPTSHP